MFALFPVFALSLTHPAAAITAIKTVRTLNMSAAFFICMLIYLRSIRMCRSPRVSILSLAEFSMVLNKERFVRGHVGFFLYFDEQKKKNFSVFMHGLILLCFLPVSCRLRRWCSMLLERSLLLRGR